MTDSDITPIDLPFDTNAWIGGRVASEIPDDLENLLQDPRGANLDTNTINLLTDYGVYDALSFLEFMQEPFSDLLGTFSDGHFERLSGDKLCDAQLFGCYLVEHKTGSR